MVDFKLCFLLFQTFLIIFSNTPPHQLGDHVNVKRPFRANSTSANSNSRDNSLNRSYSQDAATAIHRSYNTQDSTTANHNKAMNRSYIQDSTTAAVNNVMNRSFIQDSTTAAVNSVMNRSYIQDSTTAGNNVMNRSFSQDSATANAKQRQEATGVNGAASSGRSKKLAIGGGSMSRSLVQESSVSADRRSIDESLALIQHHVQVGSFFCCARVQHLPYLYLQENFSTLCVCLFMFMVVRYVLRHCS
jgi:hypothetical protein